MQKLLSLLAAPIAALLLVGAAPPSPRPALWVVEDEDTRLYLFGTVHALPQHLNWRTATFDKAFAEADMLVVEVVPATNAAAGLAPMLKLGVSDGLPPLNERVKPEQRAALGRLMAKSPVPPEALDRMESWLAALLLLAPTIIDAGFDPATGADNRLIADARKRGLPLVGLETTEQQLGYFDALAESDQQMLLNSVVADHDRGRETMQALIAAWGAGDVATMAKLASDEMRASPALEEALLTTRNRAWAAWVRQRLETPGTVMIAVGAAHLAGRNSVQDLLEDKGLKARRIQ